MIDPADALRQKVARALEEDLGTGDVTSEATVPEEARARARVVQKQPGVVYGLEVVAETMRQCGADDVDNLVVEGQWREHVPAEVLLASGPARALLAAERTALNFLGHLSGVATLTSRYAEAVEGTGASILDTRKTTPSQRWLEKAAVAAGGGINHRMGLYDAILIKENHVAAAGGIANAIRAARAANPGVFLDCEVESLDELRAAIEAGADRVLLDEFTDAMLREAVALAAGRVPLEVSGSVDLARVRAIAETGVDCISIGALTKHVRAIDLSMRFDNR
ncbi:MAG TPA: carboxylating nicotinate-nucleotide diphosphorylase [Solirubrobacterales bacterium]|nr:carboxylating nicotinate-nucleotide diphosphorylase [Solirubrobacterales bacterium]